MNFEKEYNELQLKSLNHGTFESKPSNPNNNDMDNTNIPAVLMTAMQAKFYYNQK